MLRSRRAVRKNGGLRLSCRSNRQKKIIPMTTGFYHDDMDLVDDAGDFLAANSSKMAGSRGLGHKGTSNRDEAIITSSCFNIAR